MGLSPDSQYELMCLSIAHLALKGYWADLVVFHFVNALEDKAFQCEMRCESATAARSKT